MTVRCMLQHTGLMSRWKLPEEQMALCLKAIERGYRSENPYHNRCGPTRILKMLDSPQLIMAHLSTMKCLAFLEHLQYMLHL